MGAQSHGNVYVVCPVSPVIVWGWRVAGSSFIVSQNLQFIGLDWFCARTHGLSRVSNVENLLLVNSLRSVLLSRAMLCVVFA
jgi:hypothetical protein